MHAYQVGKEYWFQTFSRSLMFCCRVRATSHENGITNGIEIFQGRSGAPLLISSNNDSCMRTFDAATLKCLRCPLLHREQTKGRQPVICALIGQSFIDEELPKQLVCDALGCVNRAWHPCWFRPV